MEDMGRRDRAAERIRHARRALAAAEDARGREEPTVPLTEFSDFTAAPPPGSVRHGSEPHR